MLFLLEKPFHTAPGLAQLCTKLFVSQSYARPARNYLEAQNLSRTK
jgi:hypothetical protein